ncbi:UDP-Glycosyltransferase/glycogen phosphorylase, partial [Lichtheimia hyalospora FSU 10163]
MVHYAFLTFDSAGHVYGIINLADKILQANPDATGTVYVACTKLSKWGTTQVENKPHPRLTVTKLYVQPDGDNTNAPFMYSLEQPDQLANDMVDGIKHNLPEMGDMIDTLADQCEQAKYHDGMLIHDQEEAYSTDYITLLHQFIPKTWFIGYLPPLERGNHANAKLDQEVSLMKWMDQQQPRSVIYVALGTQAQFCRADQVALALALEKAGFPVVWAMKKRDVSQSYRPMHAGNDFIERTPQVPCDDDGFPEGWLERMSDRVKVVEWAPQIKLLGHRATGLFVSHCGWNSLTECITVAGVPIVGVPFLTDQPMNADMMEHRLRIGCNLWKNAAHGVIDCDTAATIIQQSMTDPSLATRGSALKKQKWWFD